MALRAGCGAVPTRQVQVAARGRSVVARDSSRAPAQVVRGADVGEEAEALDVAQVQARLDQARRIDDQGRLAVLLLRLDESGNALERQEATPRIS
jgi:hypothetical protein